MAADDWKKRLNMVRVEAVLDLRVSDVGDEGSPAVRGRFIREGLVRMVCRPESRHPPMIFDSANARRGSSEETLAGEKWCRTY